MFLILKYTLESLTINRAYRKIDLKIVVSILLHPNKIYLKKTV